MKHLKFYAIAMMAVAIVGMNVSCSKDEKDGEVIVNGSGADRIKVIQTDNGGAVQLDALTANSRTYEYYYESGKLTKMIEQYDGTTFKPTLINSPFSVSYKETFDNGKSYDWKTDIKLDASGDITSYTTNETLLYNSAGTDWSKTDENVAFTYNYAKQIAKVKINGKNTTLRNGSTETNSYLYEIDFTWEDGNLVKGDVTSQINGTENRSTISISYGSSSKIKNSQMPYNLAKYGILGGFTLSNQILSFIPLIGFGTTPTNIPTYINGKSANIYLNSNGTIGSENSCTYKYASTK